MKNLFFVLLLSLFSVSQVSSECNPDNFTSECIPKLTGGFNFLKTYKVDGSDSKETVEFSYVFTKGTQYMLNICGEGGSESVLVELLDARRQVVGTNMHKGEKLPAFVFPCNTTGIYYIRYNLQDSDNFCGGSALGFKK